MTPYRCARDDYDKGILLDANENSFGPTQPPSSGNPLSLERYPSPYQIPLKEKVAALRGCKVENLFVGVGSDEAIDLLFRVFCRPSTAEHVIITPPTYGMYKVCAAVNDVGIREVPLAPDFNVRVDEVLKAVDDNTKLIFICTPGNPTSKAIPRSDIKRLLDSSYKGLLVVDEAYVDFSPEGSSVVDLLPSYPNLVVCQTLSKAFGLAGIRCGFCFGAPDVIALLNNVKAPYNLSSLSSAAAHGALDNVAVLRGNVKALLAERASVKAELEAKQYVVRVCHSDANFLLFELKSHAKETYKMMADGGVVTRFRGSELHCNNCLRVTIGKPDENSAFLQSLDKAWNKLAGAKA